MKLFLISSELEMKLSTPDLTASQCLVMFPRLSGEEEEFSVGVTFTQIGNNTDVL